MWRRLERGGGCGGSRSVLARTWWVRRKLRRESLVLPVWSVPVVALPKRATGGERFWASAEQDR